jgi:L-aminopeptidase/D-esterase-like protein
LSVGDVLLTISEAGLTLRASKAEDDLKVYPAERISPELAAAIKAHKTAIIRVVREDEEMRRTGVIQSERQVFELAREILGNSESDEAGAGAA